MHTARQVALALLIVYVTAFTVRIIMRQYYIFIPNYVRWSVHRHEPTVFAAVPIHVFFLFVDHFEPSGNLALVRRCTDRYTALAARHHDASGRAVQHTWFYPGDQYNASVLELL